MSGRPKTIPESLRRWSNTPSVNPRYKGATPADMVRALRGKKAIRHAEKASADVRPVKTAL